MHSTYTTAMENGVFPHEGGYSNLSADPGGPTNWGITIADARAYWKPDATAADVRAMPKSVAEDIYAKRYAAPLRYDDLPAGVDYTVLDYGINSGISRSGKVLRRVLGMDDSTGKVTSEVLVEVNKRDPEKLINAINDERLRFLKSLKTWPTFGAGWGRRVTEVRDLSLKFHDNVLVMTAPTVPAQAKAKIAPPVIAKNSTKATGAVVTVGSGATWHDWIMAHPTQTGMIVIGAVCVIGGILYLIERNHQNKQDAPTLGLIPVPAV